MQYGTQDLLLTLQKPIQSVIRGRDYGDDVSELLPFCSIAPRNMDETPKRRGLQVVSVVYIVRDRSSTTLIPMFRSLVPRLLLFCRSCS